MLASAATLGATQVGRAATLPQRAAAAPARAAWLEGVRQRNAVLDALFYDVGVVGQDEAVSISPWLAAEGAILVVPPSGAGALKLYNSVDGFVASGGAEVSILAVAGVGSSALGSAAFARNVADALGKPVAAVVSGYGLADMAAEALGGFFWFGMLNGVRHAFEGIDRLTEIGVVQEPWPFAAAGDLPVRQSRDTRTVLAMLMEPGLSFDLLVGHSKGNLVISEALFDLRRQDPGNATALAAAATIVTISARIAMPTGFRTLDVMGALDWFGGMNSRLDIAPDHLVAGAWHHTNTELAAHLPVTSTLRAVLGQDS
ncbi:hypothetical protein [Phenylobacterium sp.]|uniref:hypothetical protein n=1 Tax=Phenylobacterium sp. TaxID=1871053 RepID=UPI002734B5E3|nr:hypothetical protein [Phenylobacterium sp.]MDP3854111.1 hypothetical protein [Phenylobacterium sp.]